MDVKIYRKNNHCIIEHGSIKRYFSGDEMSIYSLNDNWTIVNTSQKNESFSFNYADVQNENGVYIGSVEQVEDYLTLVTNFKKNENTDSAASFSLLEDGKIVGQLAYVTDSQGTAWLPSTLGGSYYPKGWYVWNGTEWVSDRNSTAAELDTIKNDISTLQAGGGGGGGGGGADTQDLSIIGQVLSLTDGGSVTLPDTNTQLSDADITALGYVKTDNNTQLSDADITALGYIKTAAAPSFFQVADAGTSMQLTTASYATVTGVWATPTINDSDFTFVNATGVLTVNTTGIVEFDFKATTRQQGANNRHELHVELFDVTNSTSLVFDAQYASRGNAQRVGSAYVSGFKVSVTAGDTFAIRVKDVGVTASIGDSLIAGSTYLSAKLYI